MGGRGWCLESAVDGPWNLNIQHLPEPTGSPTFLLIVEKLQTFGCAAPRDDRFFFSSWRNVKPVDVLPQQSTALSSQYRYIYYFC
ncbi:hypothetical protein TNCV_463671 [Trichonephila clavipes]|nr:hypothetical protein TNCV_463671 [Trichonephila clavipes]